MENIFDKFYIDAEKRPSYVAAKVCLKIAKNIESIMDEKNITNAELARILGCTKPYITKVLRGDENLTIETLAKLSIALDAELTTVLIPKVVMSELTRHVKIFAQQMKQKNEESDKRSWLTNLKSSNDEQYIFSTANVTPGIENVNACFP